MGKPRRRGVLALPIAPAGELVVANVTSPTGIPGNVTDDAPKH